MKTCAGCGKPHDTNKKYCPTCKAKLLEMQSSGYLTEAPRLHSATVFNDERGRKIKRPADAPIEDDYSEESEP